MSFDIQFNFYEHLQKLSFAFFDSREVAEILSRQEDAGQSREILIDTLNTLINNLLYLTIVPFIVFRSVEKINCPNLLVSRIVFCVAVTCEYSNMHRLPRLEYEPTSCAIWENLFFPRP